MTAKPTVSHESIRESHPPWKARFDLVGGLWKYLVVRRISFYVTLLFINLGFSANAVTALGWILLIGGLLLILSGATSPSYFILGAILLNVWYLLDCVDGNIARFQGETSSFGALLDAMAAMIHQTFLPLCLGLALYFSNPEPSMIALGLEFPRPCWVAAGVVQLSAVLFRKVVTLLSGFGVVKQDWENKRITMWTVLPRAIIGFMLPLLFIASIVGALGVFLLSYTAYSVVTLVGVVALALHKTRQADQRQLDQGRNL